MPIRRQHRWLYALSSDGSLGRISQAIAISGLISTAAMLVVKHFQPIAAQRYFSFFYVEVATLVAITIAPILEKSRLAAVAVILNSLIFLFTYGVGQVNKKLWERGAEIVGDIVARCPQNRVHVGAIPSDEGEIKGLEYLGCLHGFEVKPVVPDVPGPCPVLYWSEGNVPTSSDVERYHGNFARATNFTAGYGLPEDLLMQAEAVKSDNSVILVVGGSPSLIGEIGGKQ